MLNLQGPSANIDHFSRRINYLRVSVTDRCNLRCFYCAPVAGLSMLSHGDILSYEEILEVIRAGVGLGIRKVRLTGGEPLVRKGICSLVSRVAEMPEIQDLSMTTNGVMLPKLAARLKDAGLKRINISLDSMKPEVFENITGRNYCTQVMEGIEAALDLGFDPVKINIVAIDGTNDSEFEKFARLTLDAPVSVRFIEYMPIGQTVKWDKAKSISSDEIRSRLEKTIGELTPVTRRSPLDGPAKRYSFAGAKGEVGFIDAMSGHFCDQCNRLRLTADGKIRPCLFSDKEIDIRGVLRKEHTLEDLERVFAIAIDKKPKGLIRRHHDSAGCVREMSTIGG